MRILKFGGTSLGKPRRLATACDLIQKASAASAVASDCGLVVVASAFSGVTDALCKLVERCRSGACTPAELDAFLVSLRNRHLAVAPCKNLSTELNSWLVTLREALEGIGLVGESSPRVRDTVLATGERLAVAALVARLRELGLNARGIDATELIVAWGGEDREALVDPEITQQRIVDRLGGLGKGEIVVVTGFIAQGPDGQTLTLGRGASDYTATLLAGVLDAEAVEIWTDVSGVLSACPGLVPEARPLASLSYEEAAEMASLGARVLHPKTLVPVARRGIPVVVRNTLRPEDPGTIIETQSAVGRQIGADCGAASIDQILAVTSIEEVSELELSLTNEDHNDQQLGSRVFSVLDRLQARPISVNLAISGQSLAWTLRAEEADRAESELRHELARELASGGRLERRDGSAVIALVGGPKAEPARLAGDLLSSLQRGGVRVRNLALPWQNGTVSQARTALAVIDSRDLRPSAQLLHQALLARRTAGTAGRL